MLEIKQIVALKQITQQLQAIRINKNEPLLPAATDTVYAAEQDIHSAIRWLQDEVGRKLTKDALDAAFEEAQC